MDCTFTRCLQTWVLEFKWKRQFSHPYVDRTNATGLQNEILDRRGNNQGLLKIGNKTSLFGRDWIAAGSAPTSHNFAKQAAWVSCIRTDNSAGSHSFLTLVGNCSGIRNTWFAVHLGSILWVNIINFQTAESSSLLWFSLEPESSCQTCGNSRYVPLNYPRS